MRVAHPRSQQLTRAPRHIARISSSVMLNMHDVFRSATRLCTVAMSSAPSAQESVPAALWPVLSSRMAGPTVDASAARPLKIVFSFGLSITPISGAWKPSP